MKTQAIKTIYNISLDDYGDFYQLDNTVEAVLCNSYASKLLDDYSCELPSRADLHLTNYKPNGISYKINKHYSGAFCSVITLYAEMKYWHGYTPCQLVSVESPRPKVYFVYCYTILLNILSSFPSNTFYLSLTPSES